MNTEETLAYLDSLPLEQALFWYIENPLPSETETAAFFRLRERDRTEREKADRVQELERVLRSVLSVIDAMHVPGETDEAFPEDPDEDRCPINDQFCFGTFENYGITNIDGPDMSRPVVIEWPDLAWAKDQIVKVLGS